MNTGERGAWNLENVVFYKGAPIKSWAIVNFTRREMANIQGEQGLLGFVNALMSMLTQMGLSVPSELPPLVHGDVRNIENALEQAVNNSKKAFNQEKPDLILVVLPNTESANYQVKY